MIGSDKVDFMSLILKLQDNSNEEAYRNYTKDGPKVF